MIPVQDNIAKMMETLDWKVKEQGGYRKESEPLIRIKIALRLRNLKAIAWEYFYKARQRILPKI